MTVGFFGKVRSRGDFVARRLPPAMQQPFDAWIQAGLVQSRADLGPDWLQAWLTGPLWRFVLAPGVCGPQAWTGVMMPSTDRVGRCFPLILAAGLDRAPSLDDCLARHAGWFSRLEDLALSTIAPVLVLDDFAAALQAIDGAPPAVASAGLDGCSAWWTEGAAHVAPCPAVCPGLPPATGFAALMHGSAAFF